VKTGRLLLVLVTPALLACAVAHATPEEGIPANAEAVAAAALPASESDAPAPPSDESGAPVPFGFRVSEGALTINSDELEADDQGGRRKIVFRKNVEVRQGDLKVTCGRLEALYSAGSKQPDRLVATEGVRLTQGDQQVWCDEAVFDRVGEKLLCSGNGRFLDGDHELSGREIEIDLKLETVRVRGDARVVIRDDSPSSPASPVEAP
jgi:lipopolysaccharide export system protein LptA